MKIILLTATIIANLAFLQSCSNGSEYYNPDKIIVYENPKNSMTLHGSVVEYDSLANPSGIECIDSVVVVLGENDGSLFSVLNSRNDSLMIQFGDIGHASNEFLSSVDMCQLTYDEKYNYVLTVQDFDRHTLNVFDLSSIIATGKVSCIKRIKYDCDDISTENHRCFSYKNDGYILSQGISSDGDVRDALVNTPKVIIKSENNIKTVSPCEKIIKSDDSEFLYRVYSSLPRVCPNGKKYVEFFAYLDVCTIIDLESGQSVGVCGNGKQSFDYYSDVSKYSSLQEKLEHVVVNNMCFNISDNYIVVCYDGNTKITEFDSSFSYRPLVKVFDWKGNLCCSFNVSESLMRIAYCEKTNKLYGFDNKKDLYCYDLSSFVN